MAKRIQLRRGNTAQSNAFTGAVGEVTVDTDKDVLVVHDGVTAGGYPNAAKANTDNTVSIVNRAGTVLGVIANEGLFNNTLSSWSTNMALTANVGRVLNEEIIKTNGTRFGVGQSWQDVLGSRGNNTYYLNATARPIQVFITADFGWGSVTVGGVTATIADEGSYGTVSFMVPRGVYYSVNATGTGGFKTWMELR